MVRVVNLQTGTNDNRLALIIMLNEFVYHRCLRRYQQLIWQQGRFELADPSTNELVVCDATLYSSSKAYAWRFSGPTRTFWLTSSGPAHGFAINSLFDVETQELALISSADTKLATTLAMYANSSISFVGDPSTSFLVAGHANFAHFIWNEMPALIKLENIPCALTGILTTFEPILPYDVLLRTPDCVEARRIAARELGAPLVKAHTGVLFSAGATRVTAAVQARVIAECLNYTGPIPAAAEGAKRIWLSLRLLYRHPVNQKDTFLALIKRLESSQGSYEILLDGYSLPHDLSVSGRYEIDRHVKRTNDVTLLASALIEAAGALSNVKLIDLTECDLPTSITWAMTADTYICHHGTQQHKIGWLSSVPGLVHVNLHLLASRPAGWVADQADGASCPQYMPADMIADCESNNDRQDNAYFSDYRFSDPIQAATMVFEFLKETLASRDIKAEP